MADAFALTYAAGELAKLYGVLPTSCRCGPSALSCYENFYAGPKPPRSFDALLKKALARPEIRDLDRAGRRRMGNALYGRTLGFIQTNKGQKREALFDPDQLRRIIPDWETLVTAAGTHCVHLRDRDRKTVKRQVRIGEKDRVLCFVIPDEW